MESMGVSPRVTSRGTPRCIIVAESMRSGAEARRGVRTASLATVAETVGAGERVDDEVVECPGRPVHDQPPGSGGFDAPGIPGDGLGLLGGLPERGDQVIRAVTFRQAADDDLAPFLSLNSCRTVFAADIGLPAFLARIASAASSRVSRSETICVAISTWSSARSSRPTSQAVAAGRVPCSTSSCTGSGRSSNARARATEDCVSESSRPSWRADQPLISINRWKAFACSIGRRSSALQVLDDLHH